MGVKTFVRTRAIKYAGTCYSEIHAGRLYEIILNDKRCFEVRKSELSLTFERRCTAVGNWPSDDVQFLESLKQKANVHVKWSEPQRVRVGKDKPRPYEDIVKAVDNSNQIPTEIEGSAAVPAGPIIERLRDEGFDVEHAGYHGRRKNANRLR